MFGWAPESPRPRAAAASLSAVFGVWLIYTFLRTPQYTQTPDPRVVPINGLHWLALGITAVLISASLVYTLGQQFDPVNADPADSEADSRSTPIENLRQQYATGNISDTEFEHKLERLIKTEDISWVSQPKSVSKRNENVSHSQTDSASSSELAEEESY
ncbi:SHOCT domain-containing protein [Halorubrum rutilum]|uniref:SHOCT domain-containing protein n=1 Tax=Halorubrum rutilum TaxID=1364933 RepID=A0ABD6APR3_9EURY|nr:SHOCT domain-containing protein [Halorubrum rutilum]